MTIQYYAFIRCDIKNVVLANGVKRINDIAFGENSNLEQIVIPKSLESINWGVFRGTKLSIVYYEGTETEWNEISISYHYNTPLSDAIKYFYSESQPTESGNYWHYVDGIPTVWE